MGLSGHHPCSISIQGNGFTRDDFWVMVFLKPMVFSDSFSEHFSSMNEGGALQPQCLQKTKEAGFIQTTTCSCWGVDSDGQWCSNWSGQQWQHVWKGPALGLLFLLSLLAFIFFHFICQVLQLWIFSLSLTHVLEVSPFHFPACGSSTCAAHLGYPGARFHTWEWERTPTWNVLESFRQGQVSFQRVQVVPRGRQRN